MLIPIVFWVYNFVLTGLKTRMKCGSNESFTLPLLKQLYEIQSMEDSRGKVNKDTSLLPTSSHSNRKWSKSLRKPLYLQEMYFVDDRGIYVLVNTLWFRDHRYLISRNSCFFSTSRLDFRNLSTKPHLSSTWGNTTFTSLFPRQDVRRKEFT